jgi:tetratricopeptide (TPR) repeat protein
MNETQVSNKWLGTIELFNHNFENSIIYLNKSLAFAQNDAQVFYNLAGALSQMGKYQEALKSIDKCTQLNPNYAGALNLKNQLLNALKNSKK